MSRQALAPISNRPAKGKVRTRQASSAKRPKQARSTGTWMMIVLLLLFLALAAGLFLPTAIVLGAAMIPSIVALMIDDDPDKLGTMTVAPLNLCGALPSVMALWSRDNSIGQAMHQLSEPTNWLMMYGAAAIGWAIYSFVPPIVSGCVVRRHEAEIARLADHQRKLVEEWGSDVANAASAQPNKKD